MTHQVTREITRITKAIEGGLSTRSEMQRNLIPFFKALRWGMLRKNFSASDAFFSSSNPAYPKLRSRYSSVTLTRDVSRSRDAFLFIPLPRPEFVFRSSIPRPSMPLSTISPGPSRHPALDSRSRWFASPCPVELFHPRLHAGLSRCLLTRAAR